jgi:hypothetical protein
MNDILSKRKLALPQVLQDIIGEFHVEHRTNMKRALEVIISMELTCFICGMFINDRPREGQVCLRKRVFCCSRKCEILGMEELRNVP